ncbi:MAG: hypothetical protein V7629_17100 [Motiliproteus sp.]
MHWITEYIGLPWRDCAYSPAAYCCYGLARAVLPRHYGIDPEHLPLTTLRHDQHQAIQVLSREMILRHWQPIDAIEDGCGVMLRTKKTFHHIGIGVKRDGQLRILHASVGSGVSLDKPAQLLRLGWKEIKYYRYGR